MPTNQPGLDNTQQDTLASDSMLCQVDDMN